MAALLTSDQNNIDRVTIEINECRKMGISVLPPDVNESFSNFAVAGKNIRFGLNAIKNVGHNIAKVIIRERKQNGHYKSLEDFLSRIRDKDLNKKSLESLIKAGALDSLTTRGQALFNLDRLLEFNKKIQNDFKNGQSNLFADLPMQASVLSLKLEASEDIEQSQKLSWEKELLGLYLSSHPFSELAQDLKNIITPLNKLKNKEGQTVRVGGIVTNIQRIITNKGQTMLFVTLEDSSAATELLVFPKNLEQNFGIWKDEAKLLVSGKISEKDGQPKILVATAQNLTEEYIQQIKAQADQHRKICLHIPHDFTKDKMNQLKNILEKSKGQIPVYLMIHNGQARKIKTNLKILFDQKLQQEISTLLGPKSWLLE